MSSPFLWPPGGCCCFGALDLYPRIRDANTVPSGMSLVDFQRIRSVYDGDIDYPADRAIWSFPVASRYPLSVVSVPLSATQEQVWELSRTSAPTPGSPGRLQRIDPHTRAVAWAKTLPAYMVDPPIANTGGDGLYGGRNLAVVYLATVTGREVRTYAASDGAESIVVDRSLPMASNWLRRWDFSGHPGNAAHPARDWWTGEKAIPHRPLQWTAEKWAGWRLIVQFGAWVIEPADFTHTRRWACPITRTWQFVVGNIESPPLYSAPYDGLPASFVEDGLQVVREIVSTGTAYISNPGGITGKPPDGVTAPQREWMVRRHLLNGNFSFLPAGKGTPGAYPSHSGAGEVYVSTDLPAWQLPQVGGVVFHRLPASESGTPAAVLLGGSGTPDAGNSIYSDNVALVLKTTAYNLRLLAGWTAASAFVIAHYKNDNTDSEITFCRDDGSAEYMQPLAAVTTPSLWFASQDRIYVGDAHVDWGTMLGAELPAFQAGTKDPEFTADTTLWGSWSISVDGSVWNPARYIAVGVYRELLSRNIVGTVAAADCIKTDTLPEVPPIEGYW